MTKKDKKEITKMICESIEKIILPSVRSIVKDEVKISKVEILSKVDRKMDKSLEEVKRIRNDIATDVDRLMKELKDMREESGSNSFSIGELDEKYLDHEKRIVKLEEKPA